VGVFYVPCPGPCLREIDQQAQDPLRSVQLIAAIVTVDSGTRTLKREVVRTHPSVCRAPRAAGDGNVITIRPNRIRSPSNASGPCMRNRAAGT